MGPEQERAFAALKAALLTPPVLSIPTADDPFILDTDASDCDVGAELVQVQDGVEKVIGYGSFALTAEQQRYCTTRKELLAIIRFTRQFRTYLLGRPFRVRTDHVSLMWLLNFKHPEGQLARWLEELGQYDMTMLHRPGRLHQNADALSRMPVGGGGVRITRVMGIWLHCHAGDVVIVPELTKTGIVSSWRWTTWVN